MLFIGCAVQPWVDGEERKATKRRAPLGLFSSRTETGETATKGPHTSGEYIATKESKAVNFATQRTRRCDPHCLAGQKKGARRKERDAAECCESRKKGHPIMTSHSKSAQNKTAESSMRTDRFLTLRVDRHVLVDFVRRVGGSIEGCHDRASFKHVVINCNPHDCGRICCDEREWCKRSKKKKQRRRACSFFFRSRAKLTTTSPHA